MNSSGGKGESSFEVDNFGGGVPLTSPPFPSPLTIQNATLGLRIIPLRGGSLLIVGHGTQNLQRQINVVDSLSVQKGSHSLKFGIDYRRLSPLFVPASYGQSVLFFNVVPSAQTGNSFLGVVSSNAGATLLFRNVGVFAQDT